MMATVKKKCTKKTKPARSADSKAAKQPRSDIIKGSYEYELILFRKPVSWKNAYITVYGANCSGVYHEMIVLPGQGNVFWYPIIKEAGEDYSVGFVKNIGDEPKTTASLIAYRLYSLNVNGTAINTEEFPEELDISLGARTPQASGSLSDKIDNMERILKMLLIDKIITEGDMK